MIAYQARCQDCYWRDLGPKHKVLETADDHDSLTGHTIIVEAVG